MSDENQEHAFNKVSGEEKPQLLWNSKAIKARIKTLWENENKMIPALLAARAGLRVLPLLASSGSLDHIAIRGPAKKGIKPEINDETILSALVSVFFSLKIIVRDAISGNIDPDEYVLAFNAIRNTGTASYCMGAVAAVFSLDEFTNEHRELAGVNQDIVESEQVAGNVMSAIDMAVAAAMEEGDELKEKLLAEIEWLSNKHLSVSEVASSPLWDDEKFPETIKQVLDNQWSGALNALYFNLTKSSELPASRLDFIEKISSDYAMLIQGKDIQDKLIQKVPTTISPEQVSSRDHLGRDRLVKALSCFLLDKNNSDHQTIGLLGHWGVGKSTVVDLLKQKIKQSSRNGEFLFANFNAWSYEHTDSIHAGVAQEMLEALSSRQYYCNEKASSGESRLNTFRLAMNYILWPLIGAWLVIWFTFKNQGWRFAINLVCLGCAAGLIWMGYTDKEIKAMLSPGNDSFIFMSATFGGVGLAGLFAFYTQFKRLSVHAFAKELKTYVKLPSYAKQMGEIPVMREHIKNLCEVRLSPVLFRKRRQKKLMFVVDDLDRCSPEKIVETFEAIRLVLDIPRVFVIIAVDERIALAALSQRYKGLADHHECGDSKTIARDYLAKMFHLPVSIRTPDEEASLRYLSFLWAKDQRKGESVEEYSEWYTHLLTKRSPKDEVSGGDIDKVNQQSANVVAGELPIDKTWQDMLNASGGQRQAFITNKIFKQYHTQMDMEDVFSVYHPAKEVTKIGLSVSQKAAFAYWTNYFDLRNPRQLKRLYNSYNLIRMIKGEDEPIDNDGLGPFPLPCLFTLCLLEYLNEENMQWRVEAKNALAVGKLPSDRRKLDEYMIQVLNHSEFDYLTEIDLFVLPAIEKCGISEANDR